MPQSTGHQMTEEKLKRLLRDAEKLKDPQYLKRQRQKSAPITGNLCNKCFYKKYCGEHNEKITCEMYRAFKKRPKKTDRTLFDGRK